ncbi:hypothetical protein E4U17_000998 [Claviceps sp. LM77 group G4]|nr:hypothetical protein E4U17_000998 [Claviceps sp. LM77 group G4]KAG6056979.1 hypothetical protein E4U33_007578 [Claviceps sp. LM78 group G4]
MALGLQVLSRELLDCPDSRALIITPRPAAEVLHSLRESLVAQQQPQEQTGGGCSLEHCLERAMLSCVFDMDGLWEVLSDLSDAEADAEPDDSHKGDQKHEMQKQTQTKGTEIQDSQDEEETLSAPLNDTTTTSNNNSNNNNNTITTITNTTPSFILITHFSTLLSGLFAQRERQAAHSTVSLLSARLNYLSRNLPPNPLIMILNSVTESPGITTARRPHQPQTRIHDDSRPTKIKSHPSAALDPSLQSIFNAPPSLDIPGYYYTGNLPRRLKPSFGLVFTQLLDLHLLCSRVARTRARDGLPGLQDGEEGDTGGVVTVVEVLMDEMGVWQGKRGVRPRREQRWTAVDVVKGRVCCAM